MIVADLYQREGGDAEATILALCKLEELYPYRNIELTKMVFGLPAVTTIPQNKPFHFSLNSYYIDLKLPQTNLDWFDFYEHGYYNSSRLAKSCQIRFGYFPEELGFVACQTITCAHEWCHCLQVQGEYGTTKHRFLPILDAFNQNLFKSAIADIVGQMQTEADLFAFDFFEAFGSEIKGAPQLVKLQAESWAHLL